MTQFEFKALPNTEALDYFRGKGFAPALNRFNWKDVWGAEHDHAFTVAKAMNDDVLKAIRDQLDEALEKGIPFKEFKKQLTPTLQEFGWWGRVPLPDPKTGEIVEAQLGSAHRLRTIYDTNIRTANSAGRWARAQRNKKLMPYLTYVQVDRPTKRDSHKPFHGATLPVDHPFWNTHWPQNDWFCSCLVKQISKRVLERDGLSITGEDEVGPMMATTPKTNPRTGEIIHVPDGIGPGFERNPGQARFNPATGGFDPVPGAPPPPSPPPPVSPPPPAKAEPASDPFAGIGKAKKEISEGFAFAPPEMVAAINATPKLTSLTHARAGAVFMRVSSRKIARRLDMDHLTKGTPEYNAVFRHEFGHAMDYGPNRLKAASADKAALDALDQDGKALIASDRRLSFVKARRALEDRAELEGMDAVISAEARRFGMGFDDLNVGLQGADDFRDRALDLLAALEARYTHKIFDAAGLFPGTREADAVAMLQDFIGAATNNKLRYRWGHKNSYYRKRGATATELGDGNGAEGFANWASVIGSGDAFWIGILRRLAPATDRAYMEILTSLAQQKR